jgi:hypothetical protein
MCARLRLVSARHAARAWAFAIALLSSGLAGAPGSASAQELSASDQYAACVLGTAAVHLRNAQAEGDPSIASDGSMFTPELFVERAWAACAAMKPIADADEDPALQDFIFTSLMNMFFCEQF